MIREYTIVTQLSSALAPIVERSVADGEVETYADFKSKLVENNEMSRKKRRKKSSVLDEQQLTEKETYALYCYNYARRLSQVSLRVSSL